MQPYLGKADNKSRYVSSFKCLIIPLSCLCREIQAQKVPLLHTHLSHDLVNAVKISPLYKANWSTCQRIFSSLVNHMCPLIFPRPPPWSDIVLPNPVNNSIVANPQWSFGERRRRGRQSKSARWRKRRGMWLRCTWDGQEVNYKGSVTE